MTYPPSRHGRHGDHAPNRRQILTEPQKRLAVENALRYVHPNHHDVLGPEFLEELNTYGRIIMRRFRQWTTPSKPTRWMHTRPARISRFDHADDSEQFDPAVAQFPHELITYGKRLRVSKLGSISAGDGTSLR